MKTYCYHLKFSSPLRITSDSYGLEMYNYTIHSDTLYSAIWSLWGWLFPNEVTDIIDNSVEGQPPFLLSSSFPYFEKIRFVPIPLNWEINFNELDSVERKAVKKIKYIDSELLKDGNVLVFNELNTIQGVFAYKGKKILQESLFADNIRTRNQLSRLNDASMEVFVSSDISFNEGSGLYFLASFDNDIIKKKFDAVLMLLGDEGIGADRRCGRGLFSYKVTDFKVTNVQNSKKYMCLSLFNPQQSELNEINFNESFYNITERGGWITSIKHCQLKKNSLNMFTEGSVFSKNISPKGRIVDITPSIVSDTDSENKYYRCGLFFGVQI